LLFANFAFRRLGLNKNKPSTWLTLYKRFDSVERTPRKEGQLMSMFCNLTNPVGTNLLSWVLSAVY
jgi:hypothetical protein